MKALIWLLRFVIPLVVLYTIGYFVAGFSALSFSWLFWLAILISLGNWLVFRVIRQREHPAATFLLNFLVAALVVFTMTKGIEGGQVPLSGSILAALIISFLQTLIPEVGVTRQQ